MHGIDSSVPLFHTRVRGIHIVVTLQLVVDVLHVPRVEHPDYPEYDRLRTVSITTQGKALATYALYLKRTGHNWGSL